MNGGDLQPWIDANTERVKLNTRITEERHERRKRVLWPLLTIFAIICIIAVAAGIYIGVKCSIYCEGVDIGIAIISGVLVLGGGYGGTALYSMGGGSKDPDLEGFKPAGGGDGTNEPNN